MSHYEITGVSKWDNRDTTKWDSKLYTIWDNRDIIRLDIMTLDNTNIHKWYRYVTIWANQGIKTWGNRYATNAIDISQMR